jgi:hypothetical protein
VLGRDPDLAAPEGGLEHGGRPTGPNDPCRVKSRTADSARLVSGVWPGRSGSSASRSGPLVTAVVRWPMPQLCSKGTHPAHISSISWRLPTRRAGVLADVVEAARVAEVVQAWTRGRRSVQGRACSSWAATRSSRSSRP